MVTPEEITEYRTKMISLYQRANAFCQSHPEADREVLIQSWLMQEETPLQKVELALLRAQAFRRDPDAH
jgi:hypothetical protein